jgi:hypothetical protein
MNLQLDMFAAGEADQLPPWNDPAICNRIDIHTETDRDHVGTGEVGRVGNNSTCIVVRAVACDGQVIKAWRFNPSERDQAFQFFNGKERELVQNRQSKLL